MADGLCGPSNALQNFQKHSTVDRTLQQDRLISRQSPSHGFRSSPGPSAGFLDHEFEAFQAGQSPLQHLESQGLQQHQGFSHAPHLNQGGPSAWASDFQRLNISSPPPQFEQRPFSQQSQQRLDTGGWHQDFAWQHSQTPERTMSQFHGQSAPTYGFSPMSAMPGAPMFAGPFTNTQAGQPAMLQQQQQTEVFDEEAFARAFEEASRSEMDVGQESARQQDTELGQDILINESAERLMESEPVLDHRLGADLIHDPALAEHQSQQDDPDALARTAGQLLDSVSHDRSDKFQNSQFLGLMRHLRDREAVIEGDKIVDTTADAKSAEDKVAAP